MKKHYSFPTKLLAATVLAIGLFSGAMAQPGTNDPTFNIPDSGPNSAPRGSNNIINASAIQSNDKKIVLVGGFTQYNGESAGRIVRIQQATGNTDAGFVTGTGFDGQALTVAIQNNNRVLVGGDFTSYNGNTSNRIARLLNNGSIDNSFVTGSGFNDRVTSLLLQPDGKVIVAGRFSTYNGTSVSRIIRLKANGTLDNTFSSAISPIPHQIALLADGKIIVAHSGSEAIQLTRLNSNGSVDSTYNGNIPVEDPDGVDYYLPRAWTLLALSDGKVLVGGAYSFGNSPDMSFLLRADANGYVDTTFHNPYPDGTGGSVQTLQLQSDGKIIVGGSDNLSFDGLERTSAHLIRLLPNGTIDNTFEHKSVEQLFAHGVYTTVIQQDGKIIAAGLFSELNTYAAPNIARVNTDGSRDITFNKISAANGTITASAVQANGRIVIGGNFSAYRNKSRSHIARLRENGTLDNSFDPGTGTNGTVTAIAVQPNGKIVIAGNFTTYNNQSVPGIVRVNSNGSIDASFNIGTGADGVIHSLNVQSDNKIILTGDFDIINGDNRIGIARLNVNGSLDAGFTSPVNYSFSSHVYTTHILPSGKILVGGYFTATSDTSTRQHLVLLNSDGTVNPAFISSYTYNVRTIAVQADGKIIAGGGAESTGWTLGHGFVARHLANGAKDFGFQDGNHPGQTFPIYSVNILSNGNIVASGHFEAYQGYNLNNIMLLDTTGTVDTNFLGNANGIIYHSHLTADGKLIIAGAFNNYNGTARNGIARIILESGPYGSEAGENIQTIAERSALSIYPNPANSSVNFDLLTPGSNITIRNVVGEVIYQRQVNQSKLTIDLSGYANGMYFVTQEGKQKLTTQKFIIAHN